MLNLLNLNFTDFEFGANKTINIRIAFVNFIKTPFWVKLQYFCWVPFLFFIYTVKDNFIKHHKDVKNSIQQPPSRCLTLNQRIFGSFTIKGFQEEIQKGQDFVGNLKQKIQDISDFCKDCSYLFIYPHTILVSLLLSITIVAPVLNYHVESEVTDGILRSLTMFFGLTKVVSLLQDRRLIGGLQIALIENVPQFLIQFYELFAFRYTVTWIQATFSLVTLIFIYQFTGPIVARTFYNEYFWDGKQSKKDFIGNVVVRKKRDRPLLIALVFANMFPPVFMVSMIEY